MDQNLAERVTRQSRTRRKKDPLEERRGHKSAKARKVRLKGGGNAKEKRQPVEVRQKGHHKLRLGIDLKTGHWVCFQEGIGTQVKKKKQYNGGDRGERRSGGKKRARRKASGASGKPLIYKNGETT